MKQGFSIAIGPDVFHASRIPEVPAQAECFQGWECAAAAGGFLDSSPACIKG